MPFLLRAKCSLLPSSSLRWFGGVLQVLCPNLHAVFPGLITNGAAWKAPSQGPHSKPMVLTSLQYTTLESR